MQAGARQAHTGKSTATLTATVASAIYYRTGILNYRDADRAEAITDMVIGFIDIAAGKTLKASLS